jgi:hypothetical protein
LYAFLYLCSYAQTSFSDFELKEIYVRHQLLANNAAYKELMVSCTKGTTDYDLAGSKTSGNFLAEAGQLASKNGGIANNVYAKPACTPVADVQAQDFANEQKTWVCGFHNNSYTANCSNV